MSKSKCYLFSFICILVASAVVLYVKNNGVCEYQFMGITYKGEFKNGKPIGKHLSYWEDGDLASELYYNKDGQKEFEIYKSPSKNYVYQKNLFKDDALELQLYFYEDGDTMGINHLRYGYRYDMNIKFKLEWYHDHRIKGRSREIKINPNTNKVLKYKGPLDFLTKRDTALLDSFYIDWRGQCLEIERKRKEGSIK